MDIALKQRLIGAIVLIAFAVIVLPMLLGGRPESEMPDTRKIELPPQPPEMNFETRRFPVREAQVKEPETDTTAETTPKSLPSPSAVTAPPSEPPEADTGNQAAVAAGTTAAASAEDDSAHRNDSESAELPAGSGAEDAAGPSGRYIVQVASFGSLDNANRLAESLRTLGYSVVLDTIKSDVGTLNRVRVGPFAGEAEAKQTAARLESQLTDVQPRIMDLEPEKASQVTTPSDPLVRWVVQVGSFSSATNADNLVTRLRQESFSAYKEQVSSSGTTIFRVRVGPFLEREEATRVQGLVHERLSLDSVVMSQD